MKILWVTLRSYPSFGGIEKHFFEFARRLVKDGHKVKYITSNLPTISSVLTNRGKRQKPKYEIREGVVIRRFNVLMFPYDKIIAYKLSKFRKIKAFQGIFGLPFTWIPWYILYAYLLDEHFDLIIAGPHPYYQVIYPALSFAKRKGVPFIDYAVIHTGLLHRSVSKNDYVNFIGRYIMEKSDHIIGNTEAEREIIKRVGVNPDKFYSIGAGINPGEIRGGDGKRFREKYNIKGNIILQISVQTEIKGTLTLLKSGELLIKKGMPINIVLIGEVLQDVKVYYKNLSEEIKKHIKILGSVSEEDKKDALDACKICIMTSKTDSFGIGYLEAWMYKKPVIGAYAGGVPYVIDDGINGYLIPFGDYHILSEYIEILLKNEKLAKKFGENGYKKTLRKYTWDIQYQKFRKLISKVGT